MRVYDALRPGIHPFSGGLPFSLLQHDIALIKAAGANYIRGAHYCQDQRWLDLCDEAGILVWEEVSIYMRESHTFNYS